MGLSENSKYLRWRLALSKSIANLPLTSIFTTISTLFSIWTSKRKVTGFFFFFLPFFFSSIKCTVWRAATDSSAFGPVLNKSISAN